MSREPLSEGEKRTNEEWCEVFGVCVHVWGLVRYPKCDNDFYTGCIKCEVHKSDLLLHNPFNFLLPGDNELGVMVRWCRSKVDIIVLIPVGSSSWLCRLSDDGYEYDGGSIALALLGAIEAYLGENDG